MKVISMKSDIKERFDESLSFYNKLKTNLHNDWDTISTDKTCNMYKKKHNNSNNEVRLAIKRIDGLYAKEIAYQFWDVDETVKLSWDRSMESMNVVDTCSQSSAIMHIKLKKMVGVTNRDCVIHSEIKKISSDEWMVLNNSIDFPVYKDENTIRIDCNVVMIIKQSKINEELGDVRSNIVSDIIYKANVNLGGWIPKVLVDSRCNYEWPKILENICESAKKRYVN